MLISNCKSQLCRWQLWVIGRLKKVLKSRRAASPVEAEPRRRLHSVYLTQQCKLFANPWLAHLYAKALGLSFSVSNGIGSRFLSVPIACHQVIVDHSHGLHECVADCGTYESESSLAQIFTHRVGLSGTRRHLA